MGQRPCFNPQHARPVPLVAIASAGGGSTHPSGTPQESAIKHTPARADARPLASALTRPAACANERLGFLPGCKWSATKLDSASREGWPQPMQNGCPAGSAYTW